MSHASRNNPDEKAEESTAGRCWVEKERKQKKKEREEEEKRWWGPRTECV